MKKKLQFIVFGFVAVFLFSGVGMAQEIQLQKNENPAPVPAEANEKDDGEWIGYYEQDTAGENAVGLGSAALFDVAIRWEPADLADYDGWEVTKIRVYMGDEPTEATAKIWQGPDEASLELKVEEDMTTAEDDWVEVSFDGYEIDVNHQLYVGWEVGDPGDGFFPAGMDADDSGDYDGYSNLALLGNLGEEWDVLSAFGIGGNLVIEAYVAPADENGDPEDHMVTLNVDMTDVEGFDPEQHSVYLTGTFAGWAEPGTDPDFEMNPDFDNGDTDATFYENWDGFEDFTTDLTPWTNIDIHGLDTWGATGFDFDGEGEPFGWRIMNPAETDPPITDDDPPYDGNKYVFSIASNPVPDTGEENKWLISPQMTVTADSELSFAAKSITDTYGLEHLKVYVSTEGNDPDDFVQISEGDYIEVPLDWETYEFDLGDYAGDDIYFAVENVSNDSFMLFLDAFQVTNIVDNGKVNIKSEHLIYTLDVEVEAGTHEYKYFSDAIGDGWDGGEWEGDPNREITVDSDMVVDDVFGEEPDEGHTVTFIVEDQDAEEITDATVVLGPFENDPGDYVFEDVPVGVHEYTVTADGFGTVTGEIEVVDEDIDVHIEMAEAYEVTLNVDMTDAVAVDDVAFDPDIHHVYLSGTFAGWTEPGEDDTYELHSDNGMIYSVSLEVEPDDHEYKYFLVEDEPSWDMGEYEGTHNREITVDGPMTIDDVWGDDPHTSVDDLSLEGELILYPNPVSTVVTVESAETINEIKVYDVAGRMVMQMDINNTMHDVNVSGLQEGFYIMQVHTDQSVEGRRFHIAR